ncbi:MAG: FAD:protein FMN transferase [Sulfurovum sp.]|nr:FAD:protein FMN transferase [Sulfurovum sp.]
MRYLLLLLLTPGSIQSKDMLTRTQVLMGTFVHITLHKKNNDALTKSFELIKKIENALSTYDPSASLAILNKTHNIKYDPYLAEAIKFSKSYYKDTDGYFDISIGSISKDLYHFGEEKTYAPSKKELENAHLDIQGISIDNHHISTDENISIDLGGMGKGYATDKVAKYLQEQNITEGIIALSGDIRCLDHCEIYLQSPYSEQTFAKITSKHSQLSISTSGTYRRFANTKEAHHLINPKTASQGREFVSVSLFSRANNAKIDAYATAISVMPKDKALAFLKNMKDIAFVIVDKQGEILFGNIETLIDIEWLSYKEKVTSPSITRNSSTNSDIDKSLIHPDTKNPKTITR